MKHQIFLEELDFRYSCNDGETLLQGMARLGQRGIPVGCCGGGCGVCKIMITGGEYESRAMSRQHVSEEEQNNGCALACRILPRSDLTVRVIGKMKKNVDKCSLRSPFSSGQAT